MRVTGVTGMTAVLTAGAEFSVNTNTANNQTGPSITSLSDGGFVVVWTTMDPAQDGSDYAVKAQRFDANGNSVGTEFLVNGQTETLFGHARDQLQDLELREGARSAVEEVECDEQDAGRQRVLAARCGQGLRLRGRELLVLQMGRSEGGSVIHAELTRREANGGQESTRPRLPC